MRPLVLFDKTSTLSADESSLATRLVQRAHRPIKDQLASGPISANP
jgi:hypothetical protein